MSELPYLIVGGGMTAAAAVQGIRQVDPQGKILLIGAEKHPPYDRPPLSKGLWKGKPLEKIFRPLDVPNLDLHLGRKVIRLDPAAQEVEDDQHHIYSYGRLLLASGGSPRTLPFGGRDILYYRTLDDYKSLQNQITGKQHFAVIGGGFIGSEIAAALNMKGQQVSMLFPENGIGAALFPPDLSEFINEYYRLRGIDVIAGDLGTALERRDGQYVLTARSGRELVVDGVIAGIGILPNTGLAEQAGLKVDNGIVVDEFLRASDPHIFAAGDVANFYSPQLDKRRRVEHEDNALGMGETAGRNMALAQPERYDHLPYFYSDLFELGYEAIGETSPRYEMVADWQEKFRKGVVYYLDQGRVRGVLLWNVWKQVDAARRLIGEPGPFKAADLMGRLG